MKNSNQNATGGSIPRDTFQDGSALETLCEQEGSWREWPLLASDGDLAALVQATSEGKVIITIFAFNDAIVNKFWRRLIFE
jgi:hypothetical protein